MSELCRANFCNLQYIEINVTCLILDWKKAFEAVCLILDLTKAFDAVVVYEIALMPDRDLLAFQDLASGSQRHGTIARTY